MIRKLIPLLLALVGLGAGVGTGLALRPAPDDPVEGAHGASAETAPNGSETGLENSPDQGADPGAEPVSPETMPDYVKLNNQFVVPILENGRVVSMVIMALSLEVKKGTTEDVHAREPKLRDVFLQVLFDHANAGGFRGSFTDGANLEPLRRALLEVARKTLGEIVTDVLIADLARQDS